MRMSWRHTSMSVYSGKCVRAIRARLIVSSRRSPGGFRVHACQNWTVGSDVNGMYPSAEGKVVIVTGGGGALGGNVSLQLAKLGAKIILADVNVDAVADTLQHIKLEVNGAKVAAAPKLDLASHSSIRGFVEWVRSEEEEVDILINNAGVNFMGVEPWYTSDGIAGGPQVNVLGPFLLTRLLEPLLLKAPKPRIINVASVMHRFNKMPNPQDFMGNWSIATYGKSKLAVVMLTNLMQKKWNKNGMVCVCVDPGAVYSGIWKTSKILGRPPGRWGTTTDAAFLVDTRPGGLLVIADDFGAYLVRWFIKALYAPPEDALAPCLHAAAAPDLVPAGYYARGFFASPLIAEENNLVAAGVLSLTDWPVRWLSGGQLCSRVQDVPMAPEAEDMEKAQELWDYCSELAGLPE